MIFQAVSVSCNVAMVVPYKLWFETYLREDGGALNMLSQEERFSL